MKLALWLGFGGGRSKHQPKTVQASTGVVGFSTPAWMAVIRLWGPRGAVGKVRVWTHCVWAQGPPGVVRLMEGEA